MRTSDFFLKIVIEQDSMQENKEKGKIKKLENLFEQIKNIEIIGERLSGEPEIFHEMQMWLGITGLVRDQIQRILEYTPSVFPEDWKSPERYGELSEEQKKAYRDIAEHGIFQCSGSVIQKVIEQGIYYKKIMEGKLPEVK